MNSLNKQFIEKLNFSSTQLGSLKRLGEFKGRQGLLQKVTADVLESLKQVAEIESTESSNRIEGIYSTPDRIRALVLKSTTPRDRSEEEIAGYRDALSMIHEVFENPDDRPMDFNNNVILQFHTMLYRNLPQDGGKWKTVDNQIVEKFSDGGYRVRFSPTPAYLTRESMEKLAENYKFLTMDGTLEPLVLIPLAILDFLCIHPFTDGNGRVSRLLSIMLLYFYDYRIVRYISLERVIEETKESYYEALEKSSFRWHEGKHDVMPWINYFWGVLIRSYKELEERVANLDAGKGQKSQLVIQTIEKKWKPFSISEIEEECLGISRELIRNVIREMKDQGKLIPKGKGRGAKWVVKRN